MLCRSTPWDLVLGGENDVAEGCCRISQFPLTTDNRPLATVVLPSAEGQQRDIPRLLDGVGQAALVWRAHAGQAPGNDLAALRHESRQQAHILVVDPVDLLDAEFANFLAAEEFPAACAGTAGAAAGTSTRARAARTAATFPRSATAAAIGPGHWCVVGRSR